MIKIPSHITRSWVLKHRDTVILIFGDNLRGTGYGGQAEACRHSSNCFGIPTKRTPCRDESVCYFTDALYDVHTWHIDEAIKLIPRTDGRQIYVIPGIGEGHARMPEKCPKLFAYLMKRLKEEFNYERKA